VKLRLKIGSTGIAGIMLMTGGLYHKANAMMIPSNGPLCLRLERSSINIVRRLAWRCLLSKSSPDILDDALLKQATLSRFQSPLPHDTEFLRSWFERPKMGSFPLLGLDRTSWNLGNEPDLVTTTPRETPEPFSNWFAKKFLPTFHHKCWKRFKVGSKILHATPLLNSKQPVSEHLGTGLFEYDDAIIHMITHIVTIFVASILPLSSVVVLYFVRSNSLRLGIIGVLSVCFSFALALMTNARKIEIFATSA
jgi:uncharacterized protein DUF6594